MAGGDRRECTLPHIIIKNNLYYLLLGGGELEIKFLFLYRIGYYTLNHCNIKGCHDGIYKQYINLNFKFLKYAK